MFCSNCGTQIADNAKFCYNCGTVNSMYKEDIESQDNNDPNKVLKKIKDQIVLSTKNNIEISDLEVVSEKSIIDCMIYNNEISFSKKDIDNITILQRLIGQASIGRNEILEYQRQMYSTDQIKQLEKEVELRFYTLDDTIKELLEELNLNYEFTTVFKYRGIITVFDKIRDVEKQISQEIE